MIKFLIILICAISLSSCGNNLFESFDDEENTTDNLINQLEYAESTEDLQKIIDNADSIINNSKKTNNEKGEAQLIKAEAIISKAGLSPLDVLGDIAETVDNPSINNFNALKIDETKKESLIEAAKEIDNAENNGVQGSNDQNLMKGITNIAVVSSVVDEGIIISDTGNITLKDSSKSYYETLETMMYPDPTDTTKTTLDYATSGLSGLEDSNSFTDDQETQIEEVKTSINKINELHTAAKNGNTYTKSDGTQYTFSGNFDSNGDLTNQSEQSLIEQELTTIFGN
jgi:hypothetical protein